MFLVAGAVAGLAAVAAPAQPASAAIPGIGDCKDAPIPQMPGRGISGWFGRPDEIPPAADPWAENPTTTVYEQYDLAGMRWWTYDLGCIGNSTDIGASSDTWAGNFVSLPGKMLVALTNSVVDWAFHPTFMATFDGLIGDVTEALTEGVLKVWLPVVVLIVGLGLMWRAQRQDVSAAITTTGWALLVMIAAAVLVQYPTQAGHGADQAITTAAGSIDGAVNGTQGAGSGKAGQTLYEAVIYRQWLSGVFGAPDSVAAKKYGPAILDATAFTWSEAARAEADPEEGKRIRDAKQKSFKETAEKIKDEDPDAYESLKGRGDSRIGLGLLTTLSALVTAPFLLASSLIMLSAYFVVRFAVMFAPVLLTIGVAHRSTALGAANAVAAAVINSVLFAGGAAVAIKVLGFILLGSGLPSALALLLAGVVSVVMWRALRPVRSATRMAGGRDLFGEGLNGAPSDIAQGGGRARRAAMRWGGRAAASFAGNAAARRLIPSVVTVEPADLPAEREPAPYSRIGGERYEAARTTSPAPPALTGRASRPHTGRAPGGALEVGAPAVPSRAEAGQRQILEANQARDPRTGELVYQVYDASHGDVVGVPVNWGSAPTIEGQVPALTQARQHRPVRE